MVEEIRLFKGGEIAGQKGRARKDDRGFQFIGDGMGLECGERRWCVMSRGRLSGSRLDRGGSAGGRAELMQTCTADWCRSYCAH